ncbi:MAG: RdgB/HAM1 family non-canonical purine NTP pyrophosphatase [Gammaproteobacteria bacterium]|nr:RdgB/HAM1 family non-canonical purine NTP pyrophosphatase [Gammaproteobacteria bacterium]MBA3732699.1 RdgB/HAM1 family non-canonical purine NTP pyrophosphatase [Gammaproteobacteria bacterium]
MRSAKRVVLASNNRAKLRELATLLDGLPFEIVNQSAFDVPAAQETGLTFVENAILKARNAVRHTALPAIADDSGLEVDALDGAPGVYSARYAGANASDADNKASLLAALENVADARRGARFRCVTVYLRHDNDPAPIIGEGVWEGEILHTPRGVNGFGYDPLFYVPTHRCASAELPAETKNRISHRARALRRLARLLRRSACV